MNQNTNAGKISLASSTGNLKNFNSQGSKEQFIMNFLKLTFSY